MRDDLTASSERFNIKELVEILGGTDGVQTKNEVLQG